MAPRRRTDPEADLGRQDRRLEPEILAELPDNVSDQLPSVSQRRSNLPRIIDPKESNQSRRSNPATTNKAQRAKEGVRRVANNEDLRNYGIDSEPLGQREHGDVEEGDRDPDEFRNWWARIRAKHPEPLAEFLATGIAVFMGLGATLSVNLSATQDVKYGIYETSCWAWGFAWMFGIYLGGGVSGAHMNPAISISLY
ncbi:hypothetical protein F5Y00DRAFT_261406 [Daldinia vernicosa]|uniref:uncharacterized protein n=1 Tax=Daldinia vernicosa TaxID=114800 RepID=UPI002007DB0D|nr:uncharacterized protein F5Y00DRAFT_261406 [Daldinia vernicosa]KAI0849621.1 hypothetical protein F5Y00DRAFT_261406 [Daldinia vernicosa]